MRFGVVNANGDRLVDRYWDLERMAERADNEPDKIFFVPVCWENLIGQMKYKPGWTFEYEYSIDMGWEFVYIIALIPDRDHPSKMTRVTLKRALPRIEELNERAAQEYLKYIIADVEMHELAEWLLFDGERVFDPHKED